MQALARVWNNGVHLCDTDASSRTASRSKTISTWRTSVRGRDIVSATA